MKKSKLVVLALSGVLLLGACNQETVVVKEGGKDVYKDGEVVVTELQLFESLKDVVGEDTVKQVIAQEILKQKYEVSDKILKERTEQIETQLAATGGLDTQLEAMGLSKEEFEGQLKAELANELALAEKNNVTEDKIKKRFEEVKNARKVQHFISSDKEELTILETGMKEGKTTFQLEQLIKNVDLSKLEDATFVKGQVPAELDEVFEMKIGEIKKIESDGVTHLIKYVEAEELVFENVKDSLEEELLFEGVSTFDDILKYLIEKHEIKLQGEYKEIISKKDEKK